LNEMSKERGGHRDTQREINERINEIVLLEGEKNLFHREKWAKAA